MNQAGLHFGKTAKNGSMRDRAMKKRTWYQNRNLLIVIAMIAVIAVLFISALSQDRLPGIAPDAGRIRPADTTGEDRTSSDAVLEESYAYVLCRLPDSNQYDLIPLPSEGNLRYPLRQVFSDGTETENVLLLTPEGFCMESSTCANQDCVHQGTVTLQNRDDRVLQNSVICLPNRLIAELYTADEIDAMNLSVSDAVRQK